MKAKPAEQPQEDLVDRIAYALPDNIRADFYREMRHCRSLPENDEILRILRIMQFLTLLIDRVPSRVVSERENLELMFGKLSQILEKTGRSSETYHKMLDSRMTGLPSEIAKNISPEKIASEINRSLNQQFILSTIPFTAQTLDTAAKEIKQTAAAFKEAADSLGSSYGGAVSTANRSIKEIQETILRAAEVARNSADELKDTFREGYKASVFLLTGTALLVGFALGLLLPHVFGF
jgi:hypothetical protein